MAWRRSAFVLGESLVLAVVMLELWRHARQVARDVALPFQVDYVEGSILSALVRVAQGLTPYPDPRDLPSALNIYGPLAYSLLAVPVKGLGATFLGPRLVIVASVVAIACLIGSAVTRSTGSRRDGVLFGALYATLPVVEAWTPVLRVDFLALAFSTAGLWVFTRALPPEAREDAPPAPATRRPAAGGHGPGTGGERRLWVAALLFAAALLVKPTFVAAPGACALYLIGRHEGRRAARLVAVTAAAAAVGLAIAAAATRLAVLAHLFDTHHDPFSVSRYLLLGADVIGTHHVLAVLALVGIAAQLARRRLSVAALWLVLASASAATAGKLGSNLNHFLEWSAALCLCAASGWATVRRLEPPRLAVASGLALTLWTSAFVRQERASPFHAAAILRDCGAAYEFVKRHPGDRILSENVGALVLGGKRVWISDPFVYSQRVMHGGRPDSGLEGMLRAQAFDLIVTSRDYARQPALGGDGAERFTPGAVRAIVEQYRPVARFRCRDAVVMWERRPAAG